MRRHRQRHSMLRMEEGAVVAIGQCVFGRERVLLAHVRLVRTVSAAGVLVLLLDPFVLGRRSEWRLFALVR